MRSRSVRLYRSGNANSNGSATTVDPSNAQFIHDEPASVIIFDNINITWCHAPPQTPTFRSFYLTYSIKHSDDVESSTHCLQQTFSYTYQTIQLLTTFTHGRDNCKINNLHLCCLHPASIFTILHENEHLYSSPSDNSLR